MQNQFVFGERNGSYQQRESYYENLLEFCYI